MRKHYFHKIDTPPSISVECINYKYEENDWRKILAPDLRDDVHTRTIFIWSLVRRKVEGCSSSPTPMIRRIIISSFRYRRRKRIRDAGQGPGCSNLSLYFRNCEHIVQATVYHLPISVRGLSWTLFEFPLSISLLFSFLSYSRSHAVILMVQVSKQTLYIRYERCSTGFNVFLMKLAEPPVLSTMNNTLRCKTWDTQTPKVFARFVDSFSCMRNTRIIKKF